MAYQQPIWTAVDCDFVGSYTAPAWTAVDVNFTDSFDGVLAGGTAAVSGGCVGTHGVSGQIAGGTAAVSGGLVGQTALFEAEIEGGTAAVSGAFSGVVGFVGQIAGATGAVSGSVSGVVGVAGVLAGGTAAISGGCTATQPQQRVSGVVKTAAGQVLAGRAVRCYRRTDGAFLGQASSSQSGAFGVFAGFDPAAECYVVAIDLDSAAEDFTPPCANRLESIAI